jgi:hypothetical protein
MNENELLRDCLQRLNRTGINYMLTGSMASNAWGIPRTTHDLDFVLQIPPSATPLLSDAFSGDYYLDSATIHAAFHPPYQFNVIHIPSALKIDFWMLRPVPFEREMFRRRLRYAILGEPAWISTPEDVILHKLYWHTITPSDRQLGDVAGVIAVQKGELNEDYLRHWASELRLGSLLDDALTGKFRPKTS